MLTTINQHDHETYQFSRDEEMLIVDERGALSPSEQVERKLVAMLSSAALPVSQLHRTQRPRRGI
jgi:hypothetical protein